MRSPKATAFGSFGYGWQQLWKYFLHLFLIGVVVWIAGIPTWGLVLGVHHEVTMSRFLALNMLATGYLMLILPVVKYGADWMYLRFMRDERANAEMTMVVCPLCSSAMVRRVAKRGPNAGEQFYGCSTYPVCRGTRAA